MNIHTKKNLKTWLVPATLLVILAGVFVTPTVVARISMNTIDPVGIVADQGRQVTATGPISVTTGERTELRVTVTQRSTGAVAEGIIFFTGTGQTNQWEVAAITEGRATFGSRTGHGGRAGSKFHQWPRQRRTPMAGERHTAPRVER